MQDLDPDQYATLIVQQWMHEHGFASGEHQRTDQGALYGVRLSASMALLPITLKSNQYMLQLFDSWKGIVGGHTWRVSCQTAQNCCRYSHTLQVTSSVTSGQRVYHGDDTPQPQVPSAAGVRPGLVAGVQEV